MLLGFTISPNNDATYQPYIDYVHRDKDAYFECITGCRGQHDISLLSITYIRYQLETLSKIRAEEVLLTDDKLRDGAFLFRLSCDPTATPVVQTLVLSMKWSKDVHHFVLPPPRGKCIADLAADGTLDMMLRSFARLHSLKVQMLPGLLSDFVAFQHPKTGVGGGKVGYEIIGTGCDADDDNGSLGLPDDTAEAIDEYDEDDEDYMKFSGQEEADAVKVTPEPVYDDFELPGLDSMGNVGEYDAIGGGSVSYSMSTHNPEGTDDEAYAEPQDMLRRPETPPNAENNHEAAATPPNAENNHEAAESATEPKPTAVAEAVRAAALRQADEAERLEALEYRDQVRGRTLAYHQGVTSGGQKRAANLPDKAPPLPPKLQGDTVEELALAVQDPSFLDNVSFVYALCAGSCSVFPARRCERACRMHAHKLINTPGDMSLPTN